MAGTLRDAVQKIRLGVLRPMRMKAGCRQTPEHRGIMGGCWATPCPEGATACSGPSRWEPCRSAPGA